ncbi:PRC-barrel domain-containing protein [Microlunatus sp. Y2014]|uniref:PRC-barrel domain-containing protein n=1 Tax=Microlunatus sp. Y2014 TaxID=3418488 RepID=UPI003DA785B9
MVLSAEELDHLYDALVFDREGDKIGTVGQIYLDDATELPNFITVRTGLFGTKETFVPVRDAEFTGDTIVLPYEKAMVKDAPNVEPDGHLERAEQQALFAYFGLDGNGEAKAEHPDSDRDRLRRWERHTS